MDPSAEGSRHQKNDDDGGRGRYMPDELRIEILSYLPSKSLMRFKSLSKYWLSVIQSPCFVSKHYTRPTNRPRFLLHHVKRVDRGTFFNDRNYFSSFLPDENLEIYSHDHFDPGNGKRRLFGPVEGIFCVYNIDRRHGQYVALWNPATHELKHLPQNHHLCPKNHPLFWDDNKDVMSIFGFGLNPVTICHKVVWLMYLDQYPPCRILHVWIYDLGDEDSRWRSAKSSIKKLDNYRNLVSSESVYMKGVCYWINMEHGNQCSILALDMATEVFREVTIPQYSSSDHDGLYCRLQALVPNESIALIVNYIKGHRRCFDTWVMEEEGNFVKKFTNSFDTEMNWFLYDHYSDDAIRLWQWRWQYWELCGHHEHVLVLTEGRGNEREDIKIIHLPHGDGGNIYYNIYKYKESTAPIRATRSSCSEY